MNIYEKVQKIKLELAEMNLKKSGKNAFAKYTYYELQDFLPMIVKLCDKHKICTIISFESDYATLQVIDSEKPDEQIKISSPMKELQLKGCNEIQALGGVETYQRRYLYMAMFDLVENDMFDSSNSQPKEYKCCDCGKPFVEFTDKNGKFWNAGQVYHFAISNAKKRGIMDEKARCSECLSRIQGV